MIEFFQYATSGFWVFLGVSSLLWMILYFAVNGIIRMWSRFLRFLIVTFRGWPPAHVDGDGDFRPTDKDDTLHEN